MRTAILCLPLLVGGLRRLHDRSRETRPDAAAKPAAAPAAATPAGQPTPARPASGDGDTAAPTTPHRPAASRREAPELRPYDRVITKEAKSDAGRVHGPPDRRPRLLRDPEGAARARSSLGQPDRADDGRRRVRRPGRRQPRGALGAARQPRPAAQRLVRDRRRREAADRAARSRPPTTTPILMAFPIEAVGKDDAPVIEVTPAVHHRGPEFSVRARLRARAFDASRVVHRARQGVPDEHRGRGHPHLHDRRTSSPATGGGRRPRRLANAGSAARQRQRRDALQHGASCPRSR